MKTLHGTGVALVTPFDESGNIDFASLKRLLVHVSKRRGLPGCAGHHGRIGNVVEEAWVLAFVIKNNQKNLPIVYGIRATTPRPFSGDRDTGL